MCSYEWRKVPMARDAHKESRDKGVKNGCDKSEREGA